MKIRYFEDTNLYEATGNYEEIDIVKNGDKVSADLLTECKSYKTAINRLFKGIDKYKEFENWESEHLIESCISGYCEYRDEYTKEHWHIEQIDINLFYVEITVTTSQ